MYGFLESTGASRINSKDPLQTKAPVTTWQEYTEFSILHLLSSILKANLGENTHLFP